MAIKIVLPFTAIHRLQCRRRNGRLFDSSAGDCNSRPRFEQLENFPVGVTLI